LRFAPKHQVAFVQHRHRPQNALFYIIYTGRFQAPPRDIQTDGQWVALRILRLSLVRDGAYGSPLTRRGAAPPVCAARSRTFSTEIPSGTQFRSILAMLGFRQAQDDTVEKAHTLWRAESWAATVFAQTVGHGAYDAPRSAKHVPRCLQKKQRGNAPLLWVFN